LDTYTRAYEGAVGTLQSLIVHASEVHDADGNPCPHAVQFYEDDAAFLNSLSEYIGSALGTGGACVVVATAKHRAELAERLKGWGIDLPFATQISRYISLDAEQTLAQFMVDGWPDKALFTNVIEPVLMRAIAAIPQKPRSLVAFGEMVALLWSDGKREAAIRLEQLWNELARTHSFTLRCAYSMQCFHDGLQDELFRQVCAEHSKVIPAESYSSLADEDQRLRMVSSLQQKAQSLNAAVEAREREIAQRKRVEEKLRRSEEFSRKIVESSIDCIKVLDLEGRIEFMNSPGQKALEIDDPDRFLGRPWITFWSVEDQPRAEAALAVAKAGGTGSFHGECATMRGTPKSWDVKITPVLGSDGEIERLIAVSRDISELKFAQVAVMQAEKLAATGRLAATIAHEINNPLEAVTNFIYLAKTTEGVPEEVFHYLQIADQELARVAQIAQQTLGFYRDNSRRQWASVAELIGDVMVIYRSKLQSKGLQAEIVADRELKIFTKQGEFKQALANLVANAIDASTQGGKLWLRAQPAKNWTNGMQDGVRITLADNGSGMTPEVQQQIFVPFFTTKADIGTGIGLWMTKSLIEKQGGYMRCRSRQGAHAGTVMSFFLPQPRLEETAAAAA
jgi:PAS domain S-box-containing protein